MEAETARPERWIEKTCLDRLQEASGQGLAEMVICATIRHRAPAQLQPVIKSDVVRALKNLEQAGRITHSAGRWRSLR